MPSNGVISGLLTRKIFIALICVFGFIMTAQFLSRFHLMATVNKQPTDTSVGTSRGTSTFKTIKDERPFTDLMSRRSHQDRRRIPRVDRRKKNTNFRALLSERYDVFPPGIGRDVEKPSEKYLIYRCDGRFMSGCGGFADRIKGMITGYLIANITGRVFKAEILYPKCRLTDSIVPNHVNWSLPVSFHKQVIGGTDVRILNIVDKKKFYNDFHNKDFNKIAPTQKYFYFKGNLDYINKFKASEIHHDKLSWMEDFSVDEIYGALFRRLFKLSPRLQELLNKIMAKALPRPDQKLVCTHIRMGRNPTIPNDSEIRQSVENLPHVWDLLFKWSNESDVAIFVMSDSNQVVERAKEKLAGLNLVSVPGPIHHVERTKTASDATMCQAQEKVMMEFFLLMHCDKILVSNSGLSRMATYVRGSHQGLYCLVDRSIIPCRMDFLNEIYSVTG